MTRAKWRPRDWWFLIISIGHCLLFFPIAIMFSSFGREVYPEEEMITCDFSFFIGVTPLVCSTIILLFFSVFFGRRNPGWWFIAVAPALAVVSLRYHYVENYRPYASQNCYYQLFHDGVIDPMTGKKIKPAVKGRKVELSFRYDPEKSRYV